ncbi:MAG: hypothetical protein U0821_23725 [Chloroflexota bacterium]
MQTDDELEGEGLGYIRDRQPPNLWILALMTLGALAVTGLVLLFTVLL